MSITNDVLRRDSGPSRMALEWGLGRFRVPSLAASSLNLSLNFPRTGSR